MALKRTGEMTRSNHLTATSTLVLACAAGVVSLMITFAIVHEDDEYTARTAPAAHLLPEIHVTNGPHPLSCIDVGSDINGDGLPEFYVSDEFRSLQTKHVGAIYLVSSVSGEPIGVRYGESASERFGHVVVTVDDLTGDGVREVAVASYGGESEMIGGKSVDRHRSYGQVRMLDGVSLNVLWQDRSAVAGEGYGESVARIGDVDGDGLSDVAVGIVRHWGEGHPSVVRVVSGRTGAHIMDVRGQASRSIFLALRGNENWRNAFEGRSDSFGRSIAALGDMNDDAVPDFVVGAPDRVSWGKETGSFQVISGKDGVTLLKACGEEGSPLGQSLIGTDDIDGDGVPDIACSSWHRHVGFYSGKTGDLLSRVDGRYRRGRLDGFGYQVTLGSDYDVDGVREVIVSTYEGVADDDQYYVSVVSPKTGESIQRLFFDEQLIAFPYSDYDSDGLEDLLVVFPFARRVAVISYGTGDVLLEAQID